MKNQNYEINLEKIKSVYIIGIGGISMSAIARLLYAQGKIIYGSDIQYNQEIAKLVDDNIIEFKLNKAPEYVKICDIVIYTSAVSNQNSDILKAKQLNKSIISRADILGLLTKDKKVISIAGTHGKTTTTALISSALLQAKVDPSIHIGGIFNNLNSNVYLGKSDYFVTEACEYKDSFLTFNNYIGVILNIRPDHLDYFKTIDNEFSSFKKFSENTTNTLIVNNDDNLASTINASCKKLTFSVEKEGDLTAKNIKMDKFGLYSFDIYEINKKIGRVKLSFYGKHNISNVLACCGVLKALNIPFKYLKKGIKNYKGVQRRFEIIKKSRKKMIIHDYAHHPDEIKMVLNICKELNFKKIITVFQPHTFSRTRDLYEQFLDCFNVSDEIWLLPIYPAREKAIKGISSYKLKQDLSKRGKTAKYFSDFNKCKEAIRHNNDRSVIFAILGAGDIVNLAYKFKKH